MQRGQFRESLDFCERFISYQRRVFKGFPAVRDAMAHAVDLFQTADNVVVEQFFQEQRYGFTVIGYGQSLLPFLRWCF